VAEPPHRGCPRGGSLAKPQFYFYFLFFIFDLALRVDFVFCIGSSFVQELSSADGLFSNGKIRTKEIKQNVTNPNEVRGSKPVSSCSLPSCAANIEKKRLKEFLFGSFFFFFFFYMST
jgi:hypothetical protein